MLFLDIPPSAAKSMRAPALAPPATYRRQVRSNPFSDRTRPIRVMLDPALEHEDDAIRSILKLARHDSVVELLCTSLDPHTVPDHVRAVQLHPLEHSRSGDDWGVEFENSSIWVPMIVGYEGLATHVFGDLEPQAAHLAVLTAQTSKSVQCDFFLTTNAVLLSARDSGGGWAGELGAISPMELARLLGVLFRMSGVLPTSVNSTIRGGVYDATIQEWLPSYMPLYRHLCRTDESGETLDYLDGLLGNCAMSLMALDRLAALHFAEDTEPANNTTAGQQQYEAASMVVALTAALESLTWVLFKLADARADRHRVTFRRLLLDSGSKPDEGWVRTVSDYCPEAVAAFRHGFRPTFQLVVHFRDLLQHHVPIPSAVAQFGDSIRVDGEPRFIEKLKAGILIVEPHTKEVPHWPTSEDAMGILPGAVMPYPFFRSCVLDLLRLVEAVLSFLGSRVGTSDAANTDQRLPTWFGAPDTELVRFLTTQL
jgi:hypothetical protein